MTRRTTTTAMAGFLILLAVTIQAVAAEPRPTASGDDTAQLKTLLDERVKVLTQLVEVLTSHYKLGFIGLPQLLSAENELCNALLDSTDDPEKRVALLTKQLDNANNIRGITQGRRQAGQVDVADVYRAESLYLDIKIKLLRERNRKRPTTPDSTGKQP